MFDIFKSAADLVKDVVTVAIAPVEAAIDLADAAIKPIAEVAKELKDDIKSLKE